MVVRQAMFKGGPINVGAADFVDLHVAVEVPEQRRLAHYERERDGHYRFVRMLTLAELREYRPKAPEWVRTK
jgi:hypothetical protein